MYNIIINCSSADGVFTHKYIELDSRDKALEFIYSRKFYQQLKEIDYLVECIVLERNNINSNWWDNSYYKVDWDAEEIQRINKSEMIQIMENK